MSKQVKDTRRGQKGVIEISKPLAKQLTQTKAYTIKDAEIVACETLIDNLEVRFSEYYSLKNPSLKNTV